MSSNSGQTAAGGSSGSHAALSAAGGVHPEQTVIARLPSGERRYWLEVDQWMFDSWNADDEAFKGFCNYLNGYAGQAPVNSGFGHIPVTNCGHKPISHELLADDGYVLGNFVQCGKDEEVVDSSRYAIFEVTPTRDACRTCNWTCDRCCRGCASDAAPLYVANMWRFCSTKDCK